MNQSQKRNVILRLTGVAITTLVLLSVAICSTQCASIQSSKVTESQTLTFSDEQIPTFVPFAANTHVKEPTDVHFIDYYTGDFKHTWKESSFITSTYFRVSQPGELNIAVKASNASGSGVVRFTIDNIDYQITISGQEVKNYAITTIPVSHAGYIQIDMQGVEFEGETFADVSGFMIGGSAAEGELHFVREADLAKEESGAYFILRGASTHWIYDKPTEDIEFFYNEVKVAAEDMIPGSYYMVSGFTGGYMGIQCGSNGGGRVLFSVWSPYVTDDPNAIPEEYMVTSLRKGEGVVVKEFGGEGSGGQSFMEYDWKADQTYKCMVQVEPDGQGNTVYTGYFYGEGKWHLIAAFKRPKTDSHCTGMYSFLESFHPATTIHTRQVSFMNQWARLTSGEWREITDASFSCDTTGQNGYRYDYDGFVDQDQNAFVLRGFGFFDENTQPPKKFSRKANGTAPAIDFDALEAL
ncbi:MAG: DUF3472 domain-containing protein [Rikenellaceae bacterium]